MAYCAVCWTVEKRIGVGTESPSHPIHVYDGGNSVYGRWERSTGNMYIGSDSIGGALGATGNIPLYFWTGDGTERMRIACQGNVGIGITDPIAKLHVEQSTTGEVARFRANVAGCADLVLVNNAQTWGLRVDNAVSNALHIRNFQNSTNIMTVTTCGNVGIGVTPAAWTLLCPLQIRNVSVAGYTTGNTHIFYAASNFYYGGGDKYITNGFASLYSQADGAHVWYSAACNTSGADAALTFNERMRITSTGNVGIGTTSPGTALDVTGTIRTTPGAAGFCADHTYLGITYRLGTGEVSDNIDFRICGGSAGGFTTGGNFRWHTQVGNTAPTERMRITPSGNVGISTTSPSTPLQIRSNTIDSGGAGLSVFGFDGAVEFTTTRAESPANAAIYLYNRPTSGINGTGTGISFRASSTNTADRPQGGFYSSWTDTTDATRTSKFFFDLVNSGTYATRMTLLGSGALGLGTTSPASRLHINHTGAQGACTIILQSTDSCGNGTISWRTSAGVTQAQIGSNYNVSDNGGNLELITSAATRLLVTSAGRIGMGVTAPNHTLSLDGNVGVVGYNWKLQSDGDGNWGFGLCNCGSTYYTYLTYGSDIASDRRGGIFDVSSNFWVAYGNCVRNFIVGNCVGIGTTTPSYRLHVNGTFYAAGSSIKYKEGICHYDTNSCLFMCLKPVTYQYKDEFKHLGKELKSDIQIGLIAEDVAEVMPELAVLVNEEDEKVVRNVDYEKLSIVLLAEVQKLRREVDTLKNN